MQNGKPYKGKYTIYDYGNHVIAVNHEGNEAHYDNVTEAHQAIDEELENTES